MGEKERPRVVCLCGSTRFADAWRDANRVETLAGRIVLSVGLLGHEEGIDMNGPIKAMLDQLHLRKIDLADEVLVLNPRAQVCPKCRTVWRRDLKPGMTCTVTRCGCGQDLEGVPHAPYVGESTRREIAYAEGLGKVVRYLEEPR